MNAAFSSLKIQFMREITSGLKWIHTLTGRQAMQIRNLFTPLNSAHYSRYSKWPLGRPIKNIFTFSGYYSYLAQIHHISAV